MSKSNQFEVFSDASNAIVARHESRNFPGILVQGDTLSTFVDDLDELIHSCDEASIQETLEIARNLRERFAELLEFYERILTENEISLPYSTPVVERGTKEN